jgi:hypothetical protein
MSVYVILKFDEDVDAMEFVKAQLDERVVVVYNDDRYDPADVHAEVAAVIKRPVRFCHCEKRVGWTRGKLYGWWVCASCGYPTEKWSSMDSWAYFMGINLLPPEISTEFRPKGWERSTKTWDFLIPKPPQGIEK